MSLVWRGVLTGGSVADTAFVTVRSSLNQLVHLSRAVLARLDPASKPLTPDDIYMRDLRLLGMPSKQVLAWYRVIKRAKTTCLSPQIVLGYYWAGFTPFEAESWMMCGEMAPIAQQARQLQEKGWSGADYLTARQRFPDVWGAHGAYIDMTAASPELLAWVRSSLPGWRAAQYMLSGVTLDEALATWEPLRETDRDRWVESLGFLSALRDRP